MGLKLHGSPTPTAIGSSWSNGHPGIPMASPRPTSLSQQAYRPRGRRPSWWFCSPANPPESHIRIQMEFETCSVGVARDSSFWTSLSDIDRLRDRHAAGHAPRPTTDHLTGFGLSVRPTQQRPGRACRQSRRRRRSRSSRSPPVAAGFPRLPPPGQRGGWPVSLWRAVRPGRCRARS